jgi:hypothetical protein
MNVRTLPQELEVLPPMDGPVEWLWITLQAAGKILAERVPLVGGEEDDVEEAVAGVGIGRDVETGPDMLDIHHFHHDVLIR